jgi:Malic enzyme, N-terminal domain
MPFMHMLPDPGMSVADLARDVGDPHGLPITVRRSGYELLNDPLLNKGVAFPEPERDAFELHGLLPPHIGSLDEQVTRRLDALRSLETSLEQYDFLRDMQDNNETAFYSLLTQHLEEVLPIVYTPTVGVGCQRFSHIYRKPRGLFLSLPKPVCRLFWLILGSIWWWRLSSPTGSGYSVSATWAPAAWGSR